MAVYVAPCLEQLRAELNTRWPGRDRASDGGIGDTAHAARVSDHNPARAPDPSPGVVRARDFDEDGIPTDLVLREAITDPRTNYVIYERRIYQRVYAFAPRPYTGPNPHDKHIHVSIRHGKQWEDDRSPWITDATLVNHTTPIPGVDIPNPAGALPDLIEEDTLAGPLTTEQLEQIQRAVWTFRPDVLGDQDAIGTIADTRLLAQATASTAGVTLADLRRSDEVDRGQLTAIQSVLASLGAGGAVNPADLAAAIPDNLAAQVADELAKRLTNGA